MFSGMGRSVITVLFTAALTALLTAERAQAQRRHQHQDRGRSQQGSGSATRPLVVAGTITSVGTGTVSITPARPANSTAVTVAVGTGTTITLDGAAGTLAGLSTGLRASAVYQSGGGVNTAIRIETSDRFRVAGTIAPGGVNTATTPNTVTITPDRPANATAVTVAVGTGTSVRLDGVAVTSLSALLPGMRAEAVYQLTTAGNIASRINANDNLRVAGTITGISGTTLPATVTITLAGPAGSTPVTVAVVVGTGTAISVNGATGTLAGLSNGMRVEVRYQVTGTGNIASVLKARGGNSGG